MKSAVERDPLRDIQSNFISYEKWHHSDMGDPVPQMSTNRACVSNLSLRISFSMPYDGDAKNWLCMLVCHLVLYTHVKVGLNVMFLCNKVPSLVPVII